MRYDEDGAGVAEEVMREVGDTRDVQHVARFYISRNPQLIPSSSKRSGLQNSALARANLILQPPLNSFVFRCCASTLNPRPARILDALASAVSASNSANFS